MFNIIMHTFSMIQNSCFTYSIELLIVICSSSEHQSSSSEYHSSSSEHQSSSSEHQSSSNDFWMTICSSSESVVLLIVVLLIVTHISCNVDMQPEQYL